MPIFNHFMSSAATAANSKSEAIQGNNVDGVKAKYAVKAMGARHLSANNSESTLINNSNETHK